MRGKMVKREWKRKRPVKSEVVADGAVSDAALERVEAKPARGRRILLVDDEAMIRDCLTEFLLHRGFEVSPATSCLDGLLEAMARPHDCLILDLNFPDINGVFLFHQLDRIDRDLARRTVFITGLDESHPFHRQALDTGAAVLSKPFDFSRLGDILESYCGE